MSTSASAQNENLSSYDLVPYPSAAFPQTNPSRLAAMARLFSVPVVPPSGARVLELGCADGSNLLPLAEQLPGASFLGIDSSKVQIGAAQQALAAVGLRNVEFRQQDILEFPADAGKFDYIIVHGVYSWVPEPVRQKIMAICAEQLSEAGVAYISYNCRPGWNMRSSLREMMQFHSRGMQDPKTKVQQSRALLTFLSESVPTENNAYGMLLKSELSLMSGLADNYLLHDILGEENTPVYFHDFVSHAAKHGLQYLSETSIAEMLTSNFPEKVRATLAQLNNNIVAQEQYMDFLRNRSFRQTLLCRAKVGVNRAIQPATLTSMSFRSLLTQASGPVELVPGVSVSFTSSTGLQLTSTDAFVKAVLMTLCETKGVSVMEYKQLLEAARNRSRPFLKDAAPNRDQIDESTLQHNLINLLAKGLIEVHAEPVAVRMDVPDKPAVGAYARHQALNARLITNRTHQSVPADVMARYIIAACDGTRSHDELLAELVKRVSEGKLQVSEGSTPIKDKQKLEKLLRPGLDVGLKGLAAAGFFAA